MSAHWLRLARALCSSISATFWRVSASLVPAGNSNTSVASNEFLTWTVGFAAFASGAGRAAGLGLVLIPGAYDRAGWPARCEPLHQAKTAKAAVVRNIFANGVCGQRKRRAARRRRSACVASSLTAGEGMLGVLTIAALLQKGMA